MTVSSRYAERLNAAIDWISQHLDRQIQLRDVAHAANFSNFHFHRVFRAHTGETLTAYVTRVRLERALHLMKTVRNKPLTDIAIESGFATASNFSRVFKARFGVSPAKADIGALLATIRDVAADTRSSNVHASDAQRSEESGRPVPRVRLERWGELRLAYVRVIGGYLKPQTLLDGYHAIEAWADKQGLDRDTSRLIGMSMDDPDIVPLSKCRYDFCREVRAKPPPRSGVSFSTLHANTWAVAECVGDMGDVEHVWNHLFREWLPASGWQPAAMPALEIFNQRPEEIGWDRFDITCCVPVEALP